MSVHALIDEFMGRRRIAVVGVSRHPADFTRALFREFLKRGYDAVPVTPHAQELEGRTCYPRVQDIREPVEAALLMTPPDVTDRVVRDCAEARVPLVWMYRARGQGAVSESAAGFCRGHDMRVIPGFCPMMFFHETPWFHRFHGALLKITGKYPS
jgi:predicted CoA-binding protein